jgi:HEAT repeat protein
MQELMDDEDALCRVRAAFGVLHAGKPNGKKALRVLLRAFKSNDRDVPTMAAATLGSFGKKYPEYLADVQAAAREDVVMRRRCAIALEGFGQDAIPLLEEMPGDDDVLVRRFAVSSLRRMGPEAKAATPALVRALVDADENVREMAAFTLSKLDPERFPEKKGAGEK